MSFTYVDPSQINQNLIPDVTATRDLGDGTHYWHNSYLTHLYVGTDVNTNLIPDGNNTRDLGSSDPKYWHNVYVTHLLSSDVNSNLVPDGDMTRDLGDGTHYWHYCYFDHVNYKATTVTRYMNGMFIASYSGTWSTTIAGPDTYRYSNSTGAVAHIGFEFNPGTTLTTLAIDWARTVTTNSVKAELCAQPVDGSSICNQYGSDVTFTAGQTSRRVNSISNALITADRAIYVVITNGTGGIYVYGIYVAGTYTSIA